MEFFWSRRLQNAHLEQFFALLVLANVYFCLKSHFSASALFYAEVIWGHEPGPCGVRRGTRTRALWCQEGDTNPGPGMSRGDTNPGHVVSGGGHEPWPGGVKIGHDPRPLDIVSPIKALCPISLYSQPVLKMVGRVGDTNRFLCGWPPPPTALLLPAGPSWW